MKNELEKELVKSSFLLFSSIIKNVSLKLKNKYNWKKAISNYAEYFLNKRGYIQILEMDKPVRITEIYTKAKLHDGIIRNRSNVQKIEDRFRKKEKLLNSSTKLFESHEITKKYPKSIILGSPGAGKTTFLCRAGLEALLSHSDNSKQLLNTHKVINNDCFPVFLEMRKIRADNNGRIDIKSYVIDEISKSGFGSMASTIFNKLKNNFLYLFDAIDEIPSSSIEQTIDSINEFIDNNQKDRYVITCRTASYHNYFVGFKIFEICPFDEDQIKIFIQRWFASSYCNNYTKSKYLINDLFINKEKKLSAHELSTNPLLLSFLCMVFEHNAAIPASKTRLYQESIDILLRRWNNQRMVHGDLHIKDPQNRTILLDHIKIRIIISYAAATLYEKNILFFDRMTLVSIFKTFLQEQDGYNENCNFNEIIDIIAKKHGLLIERENNIFSFSHLTIQEYLTAEYIKNNNEYRNRIISKHGCDESWRDIFVMSASIDQADDLVNEFLLYFKMQHDILQKQTIYDYISEIKKYFSSSSKMYEPMIWISLSILFTNLISYFESTRQDYSDHNKAIISILRNIEKYFPEYYQCYFEVMKLNKYVPIKNYNNISNNSKYIEFSYDVLSDINGKSKEIIKNMVSKYKVLKCQDFKPFYNVIIVKCNIISMIEHAGLISSKTKNKAEAIISRI